MASENESARSASTITPNDSTALTFTTRAIYVGTGGDLTVVLVDDSNPVTFKNVASGQLLSVKAKQVKATGTTASNLVGLD